IVICTISCSAAACGANPARSSRALEASMRCLALALGSVSIPLSTSGAATTRSCANSLLVAPERIRLVRSSSTASTNASSLSAVQVDSSKRWYFARTCFSVKTPSANLARSSTKPWSFLSSITSGTKLMGASPARRFSASFLFALKPGEHTGNSLSAGNLLLLKLRAHRGKDTTPRACSLDVQGGQDAGCFHLCLHYSRRHFLRTPPSRRRASARSRALACGRRVARRRGSTPRTSDWRGGGHPSCAGDHSGPCIVFRG